MTENIQTDPSMEEENPINNQKSFFVSALERGVKCPISNCAHTIRAGTVLSHILHCHVGGSGVSVGEIVKGWPTELTLESKTLKTSENTCLEVLLCGEMNVNRQVGSKQHYFFQQNAFLPKTFESYCSHMPFLIMASRIDWNTYYKNMIAGNVLMHNNKFGQHLVVIWLLTRKTDEPIYFMVTVFDTGQNETRSRTIKVRHFGQTQNAADFSNQERDHIILAAKGKMRIQFKMAFNQTNTESE